MSLFKFSTENSLMHSIPSYPSHALIKSFYFRSF